MTVLYVGSCDEKVVAQSVAQQGSSDCKVKEVINSKWGVEYVFDCGGVEFRGIGVEHAKDIEKRKVELEGSRKQVELLEKKVQVLDELVKLKDDTIRLQNENAELRSRQVEIYVEMVNTLQARVEQLARVSKEGKFKGFFKSLWFDIVKLSVEIGLILKGA